jgi:AraC-like DNA-binding protein
VTTERRTSTYTELPPARANATHFACTWIGITGDDGGYTDRVLPDACVDVIWDGRRVFIAGPDTGPVVTHATPGTAYVGVRVRPGHTPAVLGCAAGELTDRRVDAHDIWSERMIKRWEDQLSARSPSDAAPLLEVFVAEQCGDTDATDADALVRLSAQGDVAVIADELGCTPRTVQRRCVHSFGYGPKTLHRILRFRRFLALAEQNAQVPLSGLAAEAGYADQPHLSRECHDLAGLAPRPLLINRGVRSVQDAGRD